MRKLLVLLLLSTAILSSCTPRPKLVILHVNDTHSNLEPLRSGPMAGYGGAIERAAFVDSVRKANGARNVLLVHAGDFNQGTSYFSELGGKVEIDVVNAMAYDCITLGNHEFDNGLEDLAARLSGLEMTKVVCSNLDLSPFELSKYVSPYAVLEKGGMKIGFIGLVPDLSTNVSKTVSSRIPQLDDVECVNRYSDILRKDEACDMVILLSHIGYKADQELVPSIHGVDLVIGGHTHTVVDDFIYVNDADDRPVPIITDGKWGLTVGQIDVY